MRRSQEQSETVLEWWARAIIKGKGDMIAVHLASPGFEEGYVSSKVGVFARAYAAGTAKNERAGKQLADILITADTGKFSTSAYDRARELIAVGYAAADTQKSALLHFQLTKRT